MFDPIDDSVPETIHPTTASVRAVFTAIKNNFLALASSIGASLVGYLPAGTGAVATTVQAELRKTVWADNFTGASVTAKIDAAIAAANGAIVMIPATMGAGEPTTYPVDTAIIDLRAGVVLSGAKIVYNGSDANGYVRFLVLNDIVDPTLSDAAAIFSTRPTGTLPNNRNSEGIQCIAMSIGTVNNSPTGYILSAAEFGASVLSTGGKIPLVYGINVTCGTENGSTTNIGTLVGVYIAPSSNTGSGTIDTSYGLLIEDPSATGVSGERFCVWAKGSIKVGGDIRVNRTGNTGYSEFLSGDVTKYYYIDVGLTTSKMRFGISGANNDLVAGCVSGDGVIGTQSLAGAATFVVADGIPAIKVQSTVVNLLTPLRLATDAGTQQNAYSMYQGSGVPNNANGNNGDVYFRGDTPGTALQRIYVKSAGAWAGIL